MNCALFARHLVKGKGVAVIYLTSDSRIDVERLRTEIKQDFAELDGWSSVVSNVKERLKEEQTA